MFAILIIIFAGVNLAAAPAFGGKLLSYTPVVASKLSLSHTEGPVSVSALVGENALFRCNGSGASIEWVVDGSLATDISITDRGITDSTVSSSGTVQSTLAVPATLVNNGTTVQCVIYPGEVTSNTATLTVLPGELFMTDTTD